MTDNNEYEHPPAVCRDCGRRYGDEFGCPDMVVSNEAWMKISPTGGYGGILCPSCMCQRAHDAGLSLTHARFTSGPFCTFDSEIEDLEARIKVLEGALSEHTNAFKPFVLRPIGAEGSAARLQQEHEIDVHRRAREALKSGGR